MHSCGFVAFAAVAAKATVFLWLVHGGCCRSGRPTGYQGWLRVWQTYIGNQGWLGIWQTYIGNQGWLRVWQTYIGECTQNNVHPFHKTFLFCVENIWQPGFVFLSAQSIALYRKKI